MTAPPPAGMRVLRRDDSDFPKSLLVIRDPPERLYALGDVSLLKRDIVGIVGSRTPSPYGLRTAYAAAQAAARAGLVVVSGLARGLDAKAHRGALDAGGTTIAVLGSGVDVPYPKSNSDLYADVLQSGLLLSEQEPGTDPLPGAFPKRNRLIAGLARCLLVVEGRIKGGTRITSGLMYGNGEAGPRRAGSPRGRGGGGTEPPDRRGRDHLPRPRRPAGAVRPALGRRGGGRA